MRTSIGIGCDLLSRWATSQTRGAPRVATRFVAEARLHVSVVTRRATARPPIASASTTAKISAAASSGSPREPSSAATAIVRQPNAPAVGVAQRPGNRE